MNTYTTYTNTNTVGLSNLQADFIKIYMCLKNESYYVWHVVFVLFGLVGQGFCKETTQNDDTFREEKSSVELTSKSKKQRVT